MRKIYLKFGSHVGKNVHIVLKSLGKKKKKAKYGVMRICLDLKHTGWTRKTKTPTTLNVAKGNMGNILKFFMRTLPT